MGGKSRKTGGVSARLIAQLKAGVTGESGDKGKKKKCGTAKTLKHDRFDLFGSIEEDEGFVNYP